jgi:hypothetical protein
MPRDTIRNAKSSSRQTRTGGGATLAPNSQLCVASALSLCHLQAALRRVFARSPEPGLVTQCDDLYRNLVTSIAEFRLTSGALKRGSCVQMFRFCTVMVTGRALSSRHARAAQLCLPRWRGGFAQKSVVMRGVTPYAAFQHAGRRLSVIGGFGRFEPRLPSRQHPRSRRRPGRRPARRGGTAAAALGLGLGGWPGSDVREDLDPRRPSTPARPIASRRAGSWAKLPACSAVGKSWVSLRRDDQPSSTTEVVYSRLQDSPRVGWPARRH